MTVIDTSLVFPHYYGMPFRRSLKSIVHSYLNREIQAENCGGHDSYEDARACIELMLWKVRQDMQQQQPQPQQQQQQQQQQQGQQLQQNFRGVGRLHQYSPSSQLQL